MGQYNGRNDNKIYWREVYQEPNLVCEITNPALRQDLSMMRTRIVQRINQAVGSQVITDVKVY